MKNIKVVSLIATLALTSFSGAVTIPNHVVDNTVANTLETDAESLVEDDEDTVEDETPDTADNLTDEEEYITVRDNLAAEVNDDGSWYDEEGNWYADGTYPDDEVEITVDSDDDESIEGTRINTNVGYDYFYSFSTSVPEDEDEVEDIDDSEFPNIIYELPNSIDLKPHTEIVGPASNAPSKAQVAEDIARIYEYIANNPKEDLATDVNATRK